MSLTVSAAADDGTYRVDVTASRMVNGSRWSVLVFIQNEAPHVIERRAVGGGWRASFTAEPADRSRETFAEAARRGSGPRQQCSLTNSPERPSRGVASCSSSRDIALSTSRDDRGGFVALLGINSYPGDGRTRWHIELTATGVHGSRTLVFDDVSRRGALRSRVELGGKAQPRLRVIATRDDGLHCRIRLNSAKLSS